MPTKPNDNGILCYEFVSNFRYILYFQFYLGFQPPVYFLIVDAAARFVKSNQRKYYVYDISEIPAIIADSLYGCEELAEILDAMNMRFVLCCKADRPSYLWKNIHEKILNKGDSYWLGRKGINNVIFALSLLNNPKGDKSKKVNFLFNCGHPELEKRNNNPWVQQFYSQNMGEVDHANQGIHHFNYPHRTMKWTKSVFIALLQFTLWNATQVCKITEDCYNLQSKVMITVAKKLTSPAVNSKPILLSLKYHQPVSSRSIVIQNGKRVIVGLGRKSGYCSAHTMLFPNEPRCRTTRLCLGCSDPQSNIVWICSKCFMPYHFPKKNSKKQTASGAIKKKNE
jgi:hypothetical protein